MENMGLLLQKDIIMKAITEFPNHRLAEGIKAKTALAAEGKTAEEIQASLGESFKFEGDKLTQFINAIEVASQNAEKLSRVVVMSLNEGESAPPKSTKLGDHYYVPHFVAAPGGFGKKFDPRAAGQAKRGQSKGPKSSPWGLSPEEIEAKKNASKVAAASKK